MSAGQKLTPEFPADVEPARKGVYRCRWRYGEWYSLWDGREWHWGGSTPNRAPTSLPIRGGDELLSWRGLAENPSPGAAP